MTPRPTPNLPKRLLVINPNTNARVTGLIDGVARRLAVPDVVIKVVNPATGPLSIETLADRAAAEPNVIDIVRAACRAGEQGFVLACFDDIGVAEARRLAAGPVLDACEAAIMAARCLTDRFAIVTTVEGAVDRIRRHAVVYAGTASCTVRAAGIGVADAAAGVGAERLDGAITAALEDDGAKAIILGSGGLAGRADELSRRFKVPVIDGVAAAISLCQGVLRMDLDLDRSDSPVRR
ncbi:MAG: aspartate/glutamate racemase family protein [Rhodospirillales bacterium]|jgi:allantoin racemase|nr:aspartate/glutamate racemase family protein [Rhodospirillales bacterium]